MPLRAVVHRPCGALRQTVFPGEEKLHQFGKTPGVIAYEFDEGHCLSLGMFGHQRLTNVHDLFGIGPASGMSYWRLASVVPRFKKRPAPDLPFHSPCSTITLPRESTISVAPLTVQPSYAL